MRRNASLLPRQRQVQRSLSGVLVYALLGIGVSHPVAVEPAYSLHEATRQQGDCHPIGQSPPVVSNDCVLRRDNGENPIGSGDGLFEELLGAITGVGGICSEAYNAIYDKLDAGEIWVYDDPAQWAYGYGNTSRMAIDGGIYDYASAYGPGSPEFEDFIIVAMHEVMHLLGYADPAAHEIDDDYLENCISWPDPR